MHEKFCPRCGRTGKPMVHGLCIDCYIEKHPSILSVGKPSLKRCPTCLRVFFNNEWRPGYHKNVEEIVKSKVKTHVEKPHVAAHFVRATDKGELFKIVVSGLLEGETVRLERDEEIDFERQQCDVCLRKSGSYYEAIVQLRGPAPRVRELFNALRNEVRSLIADDRRAEIFRFQEARGGLDVWLGSSSVAKLAVKNVAKAFRAPVKETYKLMGVDRKTGRQKFAVTLSIRA
jgi:nonsense-mediated mRNA decay protein 3